MSDYGYIGAGQTTTGATNAFYRYDPSNDSWIAITPMPTGGRISAVAFSIGNAAYVGTGYDVSVGWSTDDVYRYSPLTNGWTQMASVGGGVDPTPIPRMEACAFALDGKGYILTGDNISSGTNYSDMYEFDPLLNTWDSIDRFPGTARRYMSATTINGVAYCGLGTNGTNFKDFWMFDKTLQILEKNLDNIQVNAFPNPASSQLNIQINGISDEIKNGLTVSIYDMMGREFSKTELNQLVTSVDINQLMNGQYMCVLSYKDQFIKSSKISILK